LKIKTIARLPKASRRATSRFQPLSLPTPPDPASLYYYLPNSDCASYRDLDKKTTRKQPQTQSWQRVYAKRLKIAETQVYPEKCLIEVK